MLNHVQHDMEKARSHAFQHSYAGHPEHVFQGLIPSHTVTLNLFQGLQMPKQVRHDCPRNQMLNHVQHDMEKARSHAFQHSYAGHPEHVFQGLIPSHTVTLNLFQGLQMPKQVRHDPQHDSA